MQQDIENYFSEISELLQKSSSLINNIIKITSTIINALDNNHKIILFGNGGSAADAQHVAAEFLGKFQSQRKSLPAISLTDNLCTLTSIANDYSYDDVFSRQCDSLVSSGDVVLGISTSGNSKNVINGLKTAKHKGAFTIGILGNDGGQISTIVDSSIIVNSLSTPHIQEIHRIILHTICMLVEKKYGTKT
ncbi:D-sedoheptulose-7-phosphate isomerase [Candidatus Nitrosotenuis uzonensis]|uniref:Putative phosphoheptose isomerase n=1 Tax=Candidatus Nitrosotenuis uzonensis TaxID=1407055 RepID=A0A812F133_9ARCH|nr:SIS domain-containing protein [Candidatus Nitrosotenuis uzonensis]CAE6487003.1 putative phosphoheptose isomerase [Candidatus Nitrosotenuis uzonensis]